jgi:RNA polymerase sigma-70 factor (ECF subfamily)
MRRARLMNVLGLGRTSEPVDLDQLTSPDASPHVRAQLAQIYALLGTLPTDDRIAWTLRCVDGNELELVAKLTSCSLATVKRRVSRVQKFLEQHFVDAHSRQGLDELSVGAADGSVEVEGAPALPERTSPPRGKAGVRLK